MKIIKIGAVIFILLFFLDISCQKENFQAKETVLDGKVHIEEELITDLPKVTRLCDEMDLTKHRIDVCGGEIYCDELGDGIPLVLLHGGPGATHHYFHPEFSDEGRIEHIKWLLGKKAEYPHIKDKLKQIQKEYQDGAWLAPERQEKE